MSTKPKTKLLATSRTKVGMTVIVNGFFYSVCPINFETGQISNRRGVIVGYEVKLCKNRYEFREL